MKKAVLIRITLYPIVLAIVGCATFGAPTRTRNETLENLAKEYHSRVMKPIRKDVNIVRIELSNLPKMRKSLYHNLFTGVGGTKDYVVGICYQLPTPIWEDKLDMAIDIDRILLASPLTLEAVLFHELAHCYHGVKHNESIAIMGEFMPPIRSRRELETYKRQLINYINTLDND
jgi:hypothetical protein